jgi:4-diphosphocytidyl-2C-methyl-D-erythritol kinase
MDYHDLQMVMLPLDLFDAIEIEKMPFSPDSFVTCDDIELANLQREPLQEVARGDAGQV